MNKIFITCFFLLSFTAKAQVGVSIYPFNNTLGVSISKISPEKSAVTLRTLELRSGFEFSLADEATISSLQPELAGFFKINSSGSVSFMSGIGMSAGFYSDVNDYWGVFVPLRINIIPRSILSGSSLHLNIEGDLLYRKFTGYTTFSIRPLVGVTYYFKCKDTKITDENGSQ